MAEPTLNQIVSGNLNPQVSYITEDASSVIISKYALQIAGLAPTSPNRAESILVALILQAAKVLTEANLATNLDQSVVVKFNRLSVATRSDGKQYKEHQFLISLYKLDDESTINPMDY